jgi:hypothetical protein
MANITLFCNDQIKYRQLRLRGGEVDKSVEIRVGKLAEYLKINSLFSWTINSRFWSSGMEVPAK